MPNTPNMNLPEPIIGSTPGPTWAQDLNDALDLIDAHDHSSGNGVQITPDGLDINADLTIGSNNLTVVRSVNFESQASPLALPADLGCIYVSLKDLYYNDEDGNQVRITQGGSVAGATGSIANLTPPASATFEAMSGTFIWESDVNTPAIMDSSSVIIREEVVSGKGVTLSAPTALASDYTITLPASAAGTTNALVLMDNSGNLSTQDKGSANEVLTMDGAGTGLDYRKITQVNMGSVGQQISSSSGSFFTTSTSFVDVTNLTVTITTTGRPVMLMAQADEANPAVFSASRTGSAGTGISIAWLKDASFLALHALFVEVDTSSTPRQISCPPGAINYLDIVAAGTYVYSVAIKCDTGTTGGAQNIKIVAYEL